jgi:hypothetical protein
MSIIKINFNLSTNTGLIQKVGIEPRTLTEIHFTFTSADEYTYFQNLNFGYKLIHNNTTFKENDWPTPPIIYEMADRTPLVVDFCTLDVDRRYEIIAYAENNGEKINLTGDLLTEKPPKPHLSWVWVDDMWKAPVEPEDDDSIVWNEDLLKWVHPDVPRQE